MAHLIAPPQSVQPMTREDVMVVQAEKRVDAATREQLVKVYGDSRDPHGRMIALTRPPGRAWKCSNCGKMSLDIRHVCGYCLSPEPGYSNNKRRDNRGPASAAAGAPTYVQRAGTNKDSGVGLVPILSTKRTYRVFTEPHVPTAALHNKAAQRAAAAAAAAEDDDEELDDTIWDDEPDCGGSCRPGGNRGAGTAGSDEDNDGQDGATATASSAERRPPDAEKVDGGFTHFISIPLGKLPAITANATRVLEDLRSFVGAAAGAAQPLDGDADVMGQEQGNSSVAGTSVSAASSGSPSKATATPDLVTSTVKLHMTLLLLTLPRREDVEFAKELLHGPFASAWAAVKEKWAVTERQRRKTDSGHNSSNEAPSLCLSGDTSLAPAHRHPLVRLGGGLQVMKAGKNNELYHPEKASVVFMGIDDPAALATVQQLQRVLHDSFVELINDPAEAERSRRVLHVTIMNKKWRKARGARRPFDARPIVEAFQDVCIGAGDDGAQLFEIPELELCSMRRQDAETGTYLAEATVKI